MKKITSRNSKNMFPSSYFGKKRLKMIHNPKQNNIFQLSFADITSHRIYCFVCHALSHADHTCHYASDYTFDQTQIILFINQIYDFMMTIVWHFVPESLFCLSHTDPESDKRHHQNYCNFQYSTCQNRSADSQLSCDRSYWVMVQPIMWMLSRCHWESQPGY